MRKARRHNDRALHRPLGGAKMRQTVYTAHRWSNDMGHRLSKIYTRTGDAGTTGLGDGSRVDKDDARIEAIGAVDELNSALGLLLAQPDLPEYVRTPLSQVQHELFDLGGELCMPDYPVIREEHTQRLENTLDALNEELGPLKEFILPGGSTAAAQCHFCRALCRRAERRLITLGRGTNIREAVYAYLNRLSDLLFVCARRLALHAGGEEVLWRKDR